MTPHIKAAACTIALVGFVVLIWFLPAKWLEIASIVFTSAALLFIIYGIFLLFFIYFNGGNERLDRPDVD